MMQIVLLNVNFFNSLKYRDLIYVYNECCVAGIVQVDTFKDHV